jgi:hypothetical protein
MRPCIARLTSADFVASNSLVRLAYENELSGVRPFRCETLVREGICLGDECVIYRYGIVKHVEDSRRGGTGVRGREPPAVSSGATARPTASLDRWTLPKRSGKRYPR